jgi:hypothetical protein
MKGYVKHRTAEQIAYANEPFINRRTKQEVRKTYKQNIPEITAYEYMRNCIWRLEDRANNNPDDTESMEKSIKWLKYYIEKIELKYNLTPPTNDRNDKAKASRIQYHGGSMIS